MTADEITARRDAWLEASSRLSHLTTTLVSIGALSADLFDQDGVFTEYLKAEKAYFTD